MKKITIYIVLALLCLNFSARSQNRESRSPLTIGDTMPDVTVQHVTNYHSKTLRLSDFRGRLVILDFWATWCGSCLKQFPHLDALASKLGKKVAIILVNCKKTRDDQASIDYTFSGIKRPQHLPVVALDTVIGNLFAYTTLPHYVWIAPDGRICAITDQFQVNEANISKILNGEQIRLPLKKD
ncbi:TlpA family protein disulfide reductase [Mucilaginibacter segetis]|uniref:TlpA family protein disulfide reductase n=1 Tax=Mucilaginibacter segetis TaxID=2793071 RepID=A0A934UM63_9SPHI|nr:TlpA disulfide reductase family protein [Mucilaginibacter segetis]MBK0378547.1 TlpA family protein disulfide reductase [Mucilaginibacter segetis]